MNTLKGNDVIFAFKKVFFEFLFRFQECLRKEEDCAANAAIFKEKYLKICKQIGIVVSCHELLVLFYNWVLFFQGCSATARCEFERTLKRRIKALREADES